MCVCVHIDLVVCFVGQISVMSNEISLKQVECCTISEASKRKLTFPYHLQTSPDKSRVPARPLHPNSGKLEHHAVHKMGPCLEDLHGQGKQEPVGQ